VARQPQPLSLPDFFNLGIGPYAPRGALAFAPRAGFCPVGTYGTPFTRVRRNQSPMLINTYLLPLSQAIPGQAWQTLRSNPLIPNPYTG
jgi:hypothetical protein